MWLLSVFTHKLLASQYRGLSYNGSTCEYLLSCRSLLQSCVELQLAEHVLIAACKCMHVHCKKGVKDCLHRPCKTSKWGAPQWGADHE